MFGLKNKKKSPDPTGSDLYDFELRRLLGLGGISPRSSSFKLGDPDIPPLPKTVKGELIPEK